MSRYDAVDTQRAARVAREARDLLFRSFSDPSRPRFQIGVQVPFGPTQAGRGEKDGDSGSRASRASRAGPMKIYWREQWNI